MELSQGSPIWKLMSSSSDIIGNNSCKIPGKGDTTRILGVYRGGLFGPNLILGSTRSV